MVNYIHARVLSRKKIPLISTLNESAAAPSVGGRAN